MLNKLMFLLILSAFIASPFYGQESKTNNTFSITGRIDHFGDGILVGTIINAKSNTVTLDTVVIKNDIFNHKCNIADKQVVRYEAGNDRFSRYRKVVKDHDSVLVDFANERLKAVEVVVYPGASIKIEGTATSYLAAYPSGNVENEIIAAFNKKRSPLFDEWSNLDYSDKKNIRATLRKEKILTDSIAYMENTFIKNNPSSIISSYLALEKFQQLNKKSTEQADSLLRLVQPHENDIYYQSMLLIQRNRLKENNLSIGDIFPDFQTRFIYKDSIFNLSQTKGKYRLIDFWGTWCIPCVREMPKLKQFYENHKDKLIIIGIAANDTYQKWKAFLDKNTYAWTQLIDQETIKLSEKLKVEVYPTKYLLDPGGKVVLLVKGSDEDVWNKIERLMNK